jgi:hypothetical protein
MKQEKEICDAKFDVLTAVKINVGVFWVVTPCSAVDFCSLAEDGGRKIL